MNKIDINQQVVRGKYKGFSQTTVCVRKTKEFTQVFMTEKLNRNKGFLLKEVDNLKFFMSESRAFAKIFACRKKYLLLSSYAFSSSLIFEKYQQYQRVEG